MQINQMLSADEECKPHKYGVEGIQSGGAEVGVSGKHAPADTPYKYYSIGGTVYLMSCVHPSQGVAMRELLLEVMKRDSRVQSK